MGDLREPNGAVLEDSSPSSSTSTTSFGGEVWARAEVATGKIIRQVQPTVASEERRRDVIDYVQRLLRSYLGCEVFPFGSVPLKTYLPDGDIDLTAFCGFNVEEGFANDVYSVLEAEDRNPHAEFVVKDVQYIRAEVKLVKCLVQNIVVDISFNQIGGLCALCFLEEVDRLIGKDHLFKRSIILIKAWCYYESRILGAHHGLISTYALETLVLHIFHLFHSSLNGPLAVLYKFLDYFSKFDWETYCVSLSGPVPLSSLPEIVAEKPQNGGGDLLLTEEFIRDCGKKFSVPSRGMDNRIFMQKHLNIVDPLKENNNLGRSVSKGNFFRIRSAFSFGARKLGQMLLQPQENIAEEVRRFFTNTLERHGQGRRPDVQDFVLMSGGSNGFVPQMLAPDRCLEESYAHEEESTHSSDRSTECIREHSVVSIREPDMKHDELSKDEPFGDESDLGIRDLRITNRVDKDPPMVVEEGKMVTRHAPYQNGKIESGDLCDNNHIPNNNHHDIIPCIDSSNTHHNRDVSSGASNELQKVLPDLSGDVESHLGSLQYGRLWYDQGLSMPIPPVHLQPPPYFQRKNAWDPIRGPVHMVPPHMNVPRPPSFFPINSQVMPGAGAFGLDEMPKTRGTGTYFPITNHQSYRDRSSQAKGRTQGQLRSPRTNGRVQTPLDRSSPKPLRSSSDCFESSPRGVVGGGMKVFKEVNGFEKPDVEFGPHITLPPLDPERGEMPPDSGSPPRSENGEQQQQQQQQPPMFILNDDRLAVQSYRLKDDGDFPPLSV